MSNNNRKEKAIENDIKNYLWSFFPYIYFWKNHGSTMSDPGQPDIACCVMGKFVGIEVKRSKGGIQSEAQKQHQKYIEDAGGVYILAKSVDEVKAIIH